MRAPSVHRPHRMKPPTCSVVIRRGAQPCAGETRQRSARPAATLSPLRQYYRWMRPKTYLFAGTRHGCPTHIIQPRTATTKAGATCSRRFRRATLRPSRRALSRRRRPERIVAAMYGVRKEDKRLTRIDLSGLAHALPRNIRRISFALRARTRGEHPAYPASASVG